MLRVNCEPVSIGLRNDGRIVVEPFAGVEVTARRFIRGENFVFRIELEKSGRTWRYETGGHIEAQKAFDRALTETEQFRDLAEVRGGE